MSVTPKTWCLQQRWCDTRVANKIAAKYNDIHALLRVLGGRHKGTPLLNLIVKTKYQDEMERYGHKAADFIADPTNKKKITEIHNSFAALVAQRLVSPFGIGVDLIEDPFLQPVGVLVSTTDETKGYYKMICTGTVINNNGWVISAAHCVWDWQNREIINPTRNIYFCPSYNKGVKDIKTEPTTKYKLKLTKYKVLLEKSFSKYPDITKEERDDLVQLEMQEDFDPMIVANHVWDISGCKKLQQIYLFEGYLAPIGPPVEVEPIAASTPLDIQQIYERQMVKNLDQMNEIERQRFDISLLKFDEFRLPAHLPQIHSFNQEERKQADPTIHSSAEVPHTAGYLVGYPGIKTPNQYDRWNSDHFRMVKYKKSVELDDFETYKKGVLLNQRSDSTAALIQKYETENDNYLRRRYNGVKDYKFFNGDFPKGSSGAPFIPEQDWLQKRLLICGIGAQGLHLIHDHRTMKYTGVATFNNHIVTAINGLIDNEDVAVHSDYKLHPMYPLVHHDAKQQYINYYDGSFYDFNDNYMSNYDIQKPSQVAVNINDGYDGIVIPYNTYSSGSGYNSLCIFVLSILIIFVCYVVSCMCSSILCLITCWIKEEFQANDLENNNNNIKYQIVAINDEE